MPVTISSGPNLIGNSTVTAGRVPGAMSGGIELDDIAARSSVPAGRTHATIRTPR